MRRSIAALFLILLMPLLASAHGYGVSSFRVSGFRYGGYSQFRYVQPVRVIYYQQPTQTIIVQPPQQQLQYQQTMPLADTVPSDCPQQLGYSSGAYQLGVTTGYINYGGVQRLRLGVGYHNNLALLGLRRQQFVFNHRFRQRQFFAQDVRFINRRNGLAFSGGRSLNINIGNRVFRGRR